MTKPITNTPLTTIHSRMSEFVKKWRFCIPKANNPKALAFMTEYLLAVGCEIDPEVVDKKMTDKPKTAAQANQSNHSMGAHEFAHSPTDGLRSAEEWPYCPECGSDEWQRGIWQEGNQEHICVSCKQSWFADIDYSNTVRSNLGERASQSEKLRVMREALEAYHDAFINGDGHAGTIEGLCEASKLARAALADKE